MGHRKRFVGCSHIQQVMRHQRLLFVGGFGRCYAEVFVHLYNYIWTNFYQKCGSKACLLIVKKKSKQLNVILCLFSSIKKIEKKIESNKHMFLGNIDPIKYYAILVTCMESLLMISPLNFWASSKDNFVLPVPVEPRIQTMGFTLRIILLCTVFT